MQPANIKAAGQFVDLMTVGAPPSIEVLACALDELALSYHDSPLGNAESLVDDVATPRVTYAEIAARFPGFGHYSVADPLDPLNEKAMVGNAIDDLVDITNDLKEVLSRFEEIGEEDAHWHFRLLFRVHWGCHLRSLAGYLHAKQFY